MHRRAFINLVSATAVIAGGDLVARGQPGSSRRQHHGTTYFAPELMVKRLELLKNATRSMTRAGVLMVRGGQSNAYDLSLMEEAAQALKVVLRPIEVGGLGEIEGALAVAGADPIGGVMILDHPVFVTYPSVVGAIVVKRGLPSVAAPVIAAHGGLPGYGVDFAAMFRHAATFVDKILKGAKPGDIPIEQATKFITIVNLKTAKALGLEIPPTLLARADEVIE
jgi:putative tryptophan/tyrosine transport system substrate-binding protein